MSNSHIEGLFANLQPRSHIPSGSQSPAAAVGGVRSPPSWSVNPAHMPNSPSPNPQTSSGRVDAQSLLNLLNYGTANKINQSSSSSAPFSQTPISQPSGGSKNASDLLALLQKGSAKEAPVHSADGENSTASRPENGESQALLNFLQNRQSPPKARNTSIKAANLGVPGENEPAAHQSATASTDGLVAKKETVFTYSNPFEALQQSRKPTPSAATPQPTASPSAIFSVPTNERGASPSEISRRKMLTPRSASAKAERLARENSVRSNGTPEPVIKAESPGPEQQKLAVRSGRFNPYPQPAKEEEKEQNGDLVEEAKPVSAQEQAAVASEEVGWKPSTESPAPPGDEWEDAEESPSPQARSQIPVYNFPIRPFISLSLNLAQASHVQIREDGIMEISRLKKEFDQLDRSLATATTKYIAYALVKNGGMRIIRQDDGSDRQVFKNSGDRIFNVSFCTTANNAPPSEHQALLGTGVSGTVYYATVSKEGNDLFEKNELDTEVLSFPPWPSADENSAGGVLKTRAKRSSRHPEYFAIGRGKSIHIIWPATAMFSRYGISEGVRQVDMELLYQERNLQIATGKAGKDFSFSEDDSLIVSLDKTGRLRFWDIRTLTDDANATVGKVAPIKIDTPLLSLMTASPAEKSWPTSVTLIDKARPYSKGGAQRYVLVGLRQNHTLQLWDIALGKAVQELNFPHENETDGVCSVNYHPASGFIVVGHPTRNSIFFIHLSAPRYAVSSSTDQATYVSMIASKDPEAPKPDSTACMSGVREIAFASKGELRSVELLSIHKSSKSSDRSPQDALFELYVVHSKGVTCLTITKEDLGLDASSKVVEGIDALKAGVVSTKELTLGSVIEESSSRTKSPPEEPSTSTSKSAKKKAKKAQQAAEAQEAEIVVDASANDTKSVPSSEPVVAANDIQKAEVAGNDALLPPRESKKIKKKGANADASDHLINPRPVSPIKPAMQTYAPQDTLAPAAVIAKRTAVPQSTGTAPEMSATEDIEKLGQTISREFKKELQLLYKDIQTDRIAQDSTSSARQESVLRLVSQTLTSNVEKTMASIVTAQIQQVVLPAITAITSQTLQADLGDAIAKSLQQTMPLELGKHIPAAVHSALTGTKFAQSIQENISEKLSKKLETEVVEIINRNVGDAVAAAAEKSALAVESRMVPIYQKLQGDRQNDRDRLEKFNTAIAGMIDTLNSMSETQIAFQNQILLDRQNWATSSDPRQVSTAKSTASPAPIVQPRAIKPKTAQELEQEEIGILMSEGRYEDASIKWLHSKYQVELFDKLFVGFTPEYLSTDVSALVAFSVAVTVTKTMETNTENRLEWINTALDAVDWRDPEIAELSNQAPQLLDTLISKVEGLYMTLAEEDISNPVIKMIPPISKKARDLRAALHVAEAERR